MASLQAEKLRGVGPVVHAGARVEPGHLVVVHCGIVGPHFVALVGLTHHATPWEFWAIDPRDAVRGPRTKAMPGRGRDV